MFHPIGPRLSPVPVVARVVFRNSAEKVAAALRERLGDRLAELYLTEVSAVIAAHVGPGVVGVVVHH